MVSEREDAPSDTSCDIFLIIFNFKKNEKCVQIALSKFLFEKHRNKIFIIIIPTPQHHHHHHTMPLLQNIQPIGPTHPPPLLHDAIPRIISHSQRRPHLPTLGHISHVEESHPSHIHCTTTSGHQLLSEIPIGFPIGIRSIPIENH